MTATTATTTTRYLWAAHPQAAWIPTDRLVEDRYHAIAPKLWRDTQPDRPPQFVSPLPSQALPYTHLIGYQQHLPQLYGFCSIDRGHETLDIPLLENIPVDNQGKLLPSLVEAWGEATTLNRAYWLWQAIELWAPLAGTGVLASLAKLDNLRVDGWCLRLCESIDDRELGDEQKLTLAKLGKLWQQALLPATSDNDPRWQNLFAKMQGKQISLREVAAELNKITIEQAARLPLGWEIAGGTDAGAQHQHNEDSYYPTPLELAQDPTGGRIAIVCDGVAGHEGGEVASQLAIKLLKLQLQNLFKDLTNAKQLVTPDRICNAIAASIRVANNGIVAQNESQGREELRRMGTTLVMAVQVNQRIRSTHKGKAGNSHEIYIAHVGDSRAYWITRDRCRLLTLDDDIAHREVRQGRDVYTHSRTRADATALTQALGMKAGEQLQPTVQRLMAIEDGILLLCSDGLSDRQLVETSWQDYATNILDRQVSLTEAVQSWLALAHGHNGDDNISLVLMSIRVTPELAAPRSGEIVKVPSFNTYLDANTDDEFSFDDEPVRNRLFRFDRAINLFLLLVTGIGLLAAIAIAVIFFNPRLLEQWQQPESPQSPGRVEGN
jgi:protein phosphatase